MSAQSAPALVPNVPVVKSAALGLNMNVPWSRPVRVDDPFEGNFLAVFDRNYFPSRLLDARRVDVVSLWSRQSIRVLLTDRECIIGDFYDSLWGHTCVELGAAKKVSELLVKVGDRVFRTTGENGVFQVSEELAKALQTAPDAKVNIRLVTERGETVDSEIGTETVRAWKTVYAS
ncbi:MAG: hypothetical protein IGS48_01000 [Oscillatoriales cyanobacterium C42_A2020_001]|nr:hypothetical protein [Leptolyngbyaceae cyanobacterium C42_A2020_001]